MRIKLRFYQLLINWDAKSGPVGCWNLKKKKGELLELEQEENTLSIPIIPVNKGTKSRPEIGKWSDLYKF